MEISNPGGLLPVVAEKFGEKSMSRNPLIFRLFTRMHLVEKVGSGIPRMRRLMNEAGLPEPIFDTKGFFTVTFMKRVKENIGSSNDPLNDPLNGTLNDREKEIYNLIRLTEGLRRNHIADKLKVSEVTIKRALQKLMGLALIEYRGSKKTGGYYIKNV